MLKPLALLAVMAIPSAAGARYYSLQPNDYVAAYAVRYVCQLATTAPKKRVLRCSDLSDNRPRTVDVEVTLNRVSVYANFRGRRVLRYSVVRR